LICCAIAVAALDPALDAQCQDWIINNQKDLIILNQVAASSHISTCQQFCMVTSAGLRADTTTCRALCQRAGGFTEFSTALNLKDGAASPDEICKALFAEEASASKLPQGAVSFVQVTDAAKQRKLGVRGDMTIQGTLVTSVLTSPIGDVKVSGEVNVMNAIESNSVQTAFLKADAGVTIRDKIVSKREQLIIKGRIDADSLSADSLSASFLEIGGVKQWALHSLEDFEEVGVDGWSHGEITECGGHRLLGGHCVENGNDLTKTFINLPPHSQIRVVAKYMFIDSWDGETGFLKLDNRPVWLESYNHSHGDSKHGINICGNETPERRFGRSIDVTIPHNGNQVTLTFGATTDEHSCDESFGIDSVMIFVR
jgi:hypothetical protein